MRLVEARAAREQRSERPEQPRPVDVAAAPHAVPHGPEPLLVGDELVVVVGLGERGAVDRSRADAGDHVEEVAALEDEVLARPDLPGSLGSTTGKHERPAHAELALLEG